MGSTSQKPSHGWASLSQEARDAAYNNRAAIADAEKLVAARRAESDAIHVRSQGVLDMPYGQGERERWEIFPGRDPSAPCLVFIHGGYWQGGEPKEFAACLRGALENGWSAALCGYPLAPQASVTQIVECVSSALSWLDGQRVRQGTAGPLVLAGWSAGAHLAAMNAGHRIVSAVLCISGIFDLAPIRDTYLNAKLNLSDEEIQRLSPISAPAVHKPFIIACGGEELPELQRQSEDFFRMRQKHGMRDRFIKVEGANHLTILEQLLTADSTFIKSAEAAVTVGFDI